MHRQSLKENGIATSESIMDNELLTLKSAEARLIFL